MAAVPSGPIQLVQRFASRLRMPQLFAVLVVLLILDLLIPDTIPFLDELLLAVLTVLVGSWKRSEEAPEKPPEKNVTSRSRREA